MGRCKYCHKFNGDHFDDEDERYDYFSCDLMNEHDMERYGKYDSKENEVLEENCLYRGCASCAYKNKLHMELLDDLKSEYVMIESVLKHKMITVMHTAKRDERKPFIETTYKIKTYKKEEDNNEKS